MEYGGRPDASADWARSAAHMMNQSALAPARADLSVGSGGARAIPEKLARMRERVKRDRSANAGYREVSREDSLYGRRKTSVEQRSRKLSNKSHGASILLQKQNFKEDPFDLRENLTMAATNAQMTHGQKVTRRLDASYERRKAALQASQVALSLQQVCDKENMARQSNIAAEIVKRAEHLSRERVGISLEDPEINRYKRTQQKSAATLTTYQQKFEKLEQNFKKFSNNIKHANQSEAVIDGLKLKAGFSVLC